MNGRELSSYQDNTNNITYKYNLDGIRTSKIVNGIETKYYLEGSSIIFEDRNGNMIYYIYNGDELLGFIYNSNTYYYHKNIFGDIIGILDSNYNEVVTYTYNSWGLLTNKTDTTTINLSTINPFRYRSYYYDEETNLYYLNSRYYNPEWGRFVNEDGILSGQSSLICYNLYEYCKNNWVNQFDYSGNFSLSIKGFIKKVSKAAKKIKVLSNLVKSTIIKEVKKTVINGAKKIFGSTNKTKILKKTTKNGGTIPYVGGIEYGTRDSLLKTNYSRDGIISANTITSSSSIEGNLSLGPLNGGIAFSTDGGVGSSIGVGFNNVSGNLGVMFTEDFRIEVEISGSLESNYDDNVSYVEELYFNGSISTAVPVAIVFSMMGVPGLALLFA